MAVRTWFDCVGNEVSKLRAVREEAVTHLAVLIKRRANENRLITMWAARGRLVSNFCCGLRTMARKITAVSTDLRKCVMSYIREFLDQ